MKTFFNVLYRRILYKIPLKFLLILLAVFAVLFASFSNADYSYMDTIRIGYGATWNGEAGKCYIFNSSNTFDIIDGDFSGSFQGNNPNNSSQYGIYCFNNNGTITNNGSTVYVNNFVKSSSSCDYSGYLTESECNNLYSGYILESSIDSAYCENNGLCSSLSSGDVSWSALYINNIQHLGGPNIYITIPEEIGRDYNYNDYDDMFISVSGYNVDYDKITGIIDVQNYKPSQEDFNNIIGILADYMPIIVIFLGLLFIYKMIRKPFKSKL